MRDLLEMPVFRDACLWLNVSTIPKRVGADASRDIPVSYQEIAATACITKPKTIKLRPNAVNHMDRLAVLRSAETAA